MSARPLRITLATGREVVVQPTLEDRLKFETTLRKNKGWGKLADNALKLEPFLAWSAATRAGEIELTWDEFTTGATAALDVEAVTDDNESDDEDLEVEGLGKDTQTAAFTPSQSLSD
ncbi:hypothetical protein [Microbacterium sp. cx-55]|uniref:hypothetical protein n=1 Tax=Microbacterium sp. cx-55 TaxID=2875948 RepID=UPI001CBF8260|nr:hypothetical protein [Microbacterium sp. cx-55]MBZ4486282.1 hypothetical protein [Microbacterium sp. cx-55]